MKHKVEGIEGGMPDNWLNVAIYQYKPLSNWTLNVVNLLQRYRYTLDQVQKLCVIFENLL